MADKIIKIIQASAPNITISQNHNRDGKDFKFEDFTPEQLELLKGPKGDVGDVGPQGIQGPKGEEGQPFTYDMFTEEQLAELSRLNGNAAANAIASAERFYRAMRYDIAGPPPEYMTIANLIVGAGPAAMASS